MGPDRLSPDYSTSYSASSFGNTVLFAGMWIDPTTGLGRTSTRRDDTVIDTFMTADPRRRARTGTSTAATTRPTKPTPPGWSRTSPGPRRATPAMLVRRALAAHRSHVMPAERPIHDLQRFDRDSIFRQQRSGTYLYADHSGTVTTASTPADGHPPRNLGFDWWAGSHMSVRIGGGLQSAAGMARRRADTASWFSAGSLRSGR